MVGFIRAACYILPFNSFPSDLFGSEINLEEVDAETAPTPTEVPDLKTPTNGTPNKFFTDSNAFSEGRSNFSGEQLIQAWKIYKMRRR